MAHLIEPQRHPFGENPADGGVGRLHGTAARPVARARPVRDAQFGDFGGRAVEFIGDREEGPLGTGERADAGDHLGQDGIGVGSGQELGGDIARRRDPLLPGARRLVQARVVDGGARRGRQRLHDHLVVLGERRSTGLLGQIQIPEDLLANAHGHTEEGPHMRMMVGEPDRGRMIGEIVQTNGFGLVEQQTQHALALGHITDAARRGLVDTLVDEP